MLGSAAKWCCCGTLLLVALPRVSAGAEKEHLGRGKKATALVVIESGGKKKFGSAFCIHAGGYFVTNSHVAGNLGPREHLKLVLNSGEKDQQIVDARVVRKSQDADLCLLKVEAASLTTLPIAGVE